jgi:hypothetical protein
MWDCTPAAGSMESASDQGICEEPMTGIEPALSAWEAEVLPLNYIGMRHPEP